MAPLTVIKSRQDQRVAAVLLGMERCRAHSFRLEALAVDARPIVAVTLDDRRHLLSPGDARLAARCLDFEGRRFPSLLASLFDSAACDAEVLADPDAAARRQKLIA